MCFFLILCLWQEKSGCESTGIKTYVIHQPTSHVVFLCGHCPVFLWSCPLAVASTSTRWHARSSPCLLRACCCPSVQCFCPGLDRGTMHLCELNYFTRFRNFHPRRLGNENTRLCSWSDFCATVSVVACATSSFCPVASQKPQA